MTQCGKEQKDAHSGHVCGTRCQRHPGPIDRKLTVQSLQKRNPCIENDMSNFPNFHQST